MFYNLPDMRRKLQRIAISNITGQVQFKGQNVIFGNTLTEKVTLEQIAKQIVKTKIISIIRETMTL